MVEEEIAESLGSIVRAFEAELGQIERSFHECENHSLVRGYIEYLPAEEGCLFAIWDAWSRFLRTIAMACSAGPVEGMSGQIYRTEKPRTEPEVLEYLHESKNGQKYRFVNGEPSWHVSTQFCDIVTVLELQNAAALIGAVTASQVVLGPVIVDSPLEEIRIARNFSAHKNWKTFQDISAFSESFTTLSDHVRKRRSGVTTFSEWVECLLSLAVAAAQ